VVTPDLLEKLRAAYKQWHDSLGQNTSAWLDLMSEHVKLRSIADGGAGMEFSAPRDGKAAVRAYFAALAEDWEMVHYTPEEFLTDGAQVAVFGCCSFRNRRTGKTVESPVIHRWKFSGGLATDCYEFYDTAKTFAAATPDPA
jgi:uncharacterized protein